MATEEYSIRVSVDSTDATRAERNLNNLTSSVTQTERALNSTSSAARSSAAALAGVNGSASASTRSMLSLANAAKLAATSFAAISFKNAISEIATFETRMLQLTALTGASTAQMKEMEKQARELGATTAFSAQQAAEAQGVLASAGLKTNEILTATPKVLQLAAAGSLDLSKAAEISTGTMKGLGLQLSDLGRINDVFAKAAADSSTNVQQIGDAMGQIAPIAKTYGIGLETLTASLGILADNQIKGSEAGNNFKSMLVALSNDTKDNVEILKKHGVTYSQLNVEVYGLTKVMQTLKNAHLSGAESLKIFGSDAAAAGNILADNAGKISDYTKELEKADGAAKKAADTLNQGLAKAFDSLKGTLSEAALQLGDSGLKGALTGVIQQATGVISIYEGMGDKFAESNNLTKEQYTNLKDIADELKIVAGAAGGIAGLTAAIWGANAAMVAFNIATRANPLIMGATVVAAAAGATFAKIADNQSTIDKQIETAEKRIAAMEKYGLPNLIGTAVGFDTEKERTKLTALKQFKEEQLAATKATIDATAKTEKHIEAAKTNTAATADSTDKTKKLTAEQKQANKEQTEYQRLIESTPYGAYNATIDKLTEGLKRGGEAFRATYATGVEEANKKLLDSTKYVKEHTKALEEEKRALEGTARGKFEKGYSELMTQKPYMSDTEYSAGQDKLTADYLTQQQGVDFKTPAQEGKEALKAFNDEMDNTSKAFDKLGNSGSMAFDGILGGISAVAGAASSFATEIIKISDKQQASQEKYDAVIKSVGVTEEEKADATKKFAADKIKLDSQAFAAEITGARQIAGATSKLFGEKSAARKAFHAIEMGMSVIEMAMSAKKMIVDVAAGAARMFSQGGFAGFAGVAAMAAVMGGLGFAIMGGSSKTVDNTIPATKSTGTILGDENATSNSVREIVDTLNDISDKEYPELKAISDGFRGLDNSMYKLNQIIAQSSASFKNTQAIGVPSSPTGVKAVNPNGSVGMQVGGLAVGTAAGALGVGAAGAAAIGLGGLSTAITGAAIGTGAAVGAGSGMAGIVAGGAIIGLAGGLVIAGLAYGLGKLLGIGKTKITQMGEGIVINANSLLTNGMLSAVDAQTWRKDEFKTKGWFSSKKRIVETFGALSDDVYESIANTIGGISNVSLMLANELGILDQTAARMEMQGSMPFLKIDWFLQKQKGEDVTKLMNDQLNAYFDRIAENLFKNLLGEFQQIGEGMLQTAARVTTEMVVVKASYKKLGFDVGEASVGLAGFSDRLVQMYNSTADAKDGLKNFIETINDVYDITHTQGQKTQYTITEIKKALTGDTFKNVTGDNFDTAKMFDDAYIRQTLLTLTAKTADLAKSASDSESKVKSMSNAVQDFYTPQKTMGENLFDVIAKAWGTKDINADWYTYTGVNKATDPKLTSITSINSLLTGTYGTWWKNLETASDAGYKAVYKFIKSVTDIKTSGAEAGGASISPEQQAANLNAARIASETAAELAKSSNDLTIMAQDLLDKAIPAFTKIQDEYLKTTMSSEKWLQVERGRIIEKEFKGIEDNMLDYANLNQITNEMVAQGFEGVTKAGKITAEQMQRFVWSLEDAAKSTKTLSESGKYVTDFSKSISAWIKNIRATSMGSPETQLNMAKANFEEQLKLAKFGATAEEKRAAMSGITGYADTYMNAIKSYYATSEQGQKALEGIISQVGDLGQSIDVQELQLGALNDIKDGIYEIPKGISDANKELFNGLVSELKTAGDVAKINPTVQNQLRYDALAKIVLMIDKSAKSGVDAAFMDKFIQSVAGEGSLTSNVNLVISSAEFDAAQKTAIIGNVLASFNEQVLTLKNFSFDVKAAVDAAKKLVLETWGEPKLDVSTADVIKKIAEIDKLSRELNSLITTKNGVTVLSDDAKAKIAEIDGKSKELNALISKNNLLNVLPDDAKLKIADISKLSSDLNTLISKDNSVSVLDETAIQKIKDLTGSATGLNGELSKVVTMDVNNETILAKIAQIIGAASAAIASLSAMTVENNNTIASANAAIAASNAAKAASDAAAAAASNAAAAAASQAAESAKAAGALLTLSQAQIDALSKTPVQFQSAESAKYWQQQSNLDLIQTVMPKFANGGIANQPSMFGEAGAEAAVPLPDGRSIPVTLYNASNDSSVNSAETIAELKSQNQKLEILVNTMMATSKAEREKTQELIDAMNGLRTDTRLKAKG